MLFLLFNKGNNDEHWLSSGISISDKSLCKLICIDRTGLDYFFVIDYRSVYY